MTELPPAAIDHAPAFRRASNILLFLGILSAWTSQLHTVFLQGAFEYVQLDGVLFMIAYLWGAYWTRRKSVTAFLFAVVVFTISAISGFVISFRNAELMDTLLGEGSFWWITGGNLVYVLIVHFFMFRAWKALPRTSD